MAKTDVSKPVEGTVDKPRYFDGFMHRSEGALVRGRLMVYRTGEGVVAGSRLTTIFDVDRPVSEVWEQFKDFNRWQNAAGFYYSGVIGDLGGKTFRLSEKPNDGGPHQYEVAHVIPEYLIVVNEPMPETGWVDPARPAIGADGGGGRAGVITFGLDDYDGKTTVTMFGEHATVVARGSDADSMTDEEAVAPWREVNDGSGKKWAEILIPGLRQLVYEA